MKSVVSTNNKGFTLIEVMVSLIVLAIGLLSLMGLQLVALKGTNQAHFRTEASLLMMNLANRMRSNPNGVDIGAYRSIQPVSCTQSPEKACLFNDCSGLELAKYDLYSIACGIEKGSRNSRDGGGIKQLLPEGSLTISCLDDDCASIGNKRKAHTFSIKWMESKNKSEDMTTGPRTERSINLTINP